jgi:dATP pyrophosphohydrolase
VSTAERASRKGYPERVTTRMRAPFQVLVLPYRREEDGGHAYALFQREDAGYWQGVAGGGEEGETPLQAASREVAEEAGLDSRAGLWALDSVATVPVVDVTGTFLWGPDVLVIPEYAFGVRCPSANLVLSDEHTAFLWFTFAEAVGKLKWDSNRTALWELDHRLRHNLPPGAAHSRAIIGES